jgi:hypothetical protein
MSIGFGIFLLVLGAILSFAVQDSFSGFDLTMIGYILMAGGALVTLLSVAFLARKNKSVSTVREVADPVTGERVSRRESEIQ